MHEMHQDVERILYTEEELNARVKELAAEIQRDYEGKDLVMACVLRGSYIFMADLTRAIDLPLCVDFMVVSSYGSGTVSSGQVEIRKDLSESIEGKDLLIVEDILDSGNTLYYLMDVLKVRKPASIKICTLMDKPDRRTKPITAEYTGFTIPDAVKSKATSKTDSAVTRVDAAIVEEGADYTVGILQLLQHENH